MDLIISTVTGEAKIVYHVRTYFINDRPITEVYINMDCSKDGFLALVVQAEESEDAINE